MQKEEFVRQIQMNQGIMLKICRLYRHAVQDREDLFQEIVIQYIFSDGGLYAGRMDYFD